MKFPRTSRGEFFARQSLTPAVQTVFAECVLASTASFVLHSLLWLHPSLRPSSRPACSPLSFGFPGLRPQTTGASSEPNPRPQSKPNTEENRRDSASVGSAVRFLQTSGQWAMLAFIPRPEPHLHYPLPLFIILFFNKHCVSSSVFARYSVNHF